MLKLRISVFAVSLFLISVTLAQDSELDEWLEMDLSDLMNIKVTTATKREQLIDKVPATVRIITEKEIQERAYHSLEDVLKDLPGFQFRNILGFNSYTFQRGAPSQNNLILVMIDGVQINELNSGGFYGGYHYNLQNIKRIEVVYGPSSALYGTNAISGIINLITKDAEDGPRAEASLTTGSFGTLFGDVGWRLKPENLPFSATFSAFYKQTEKADLGGTKGDNNWSENMENFENDYGFDSKIKYKNTILGLTLQDKQASRTTNYKSLGTNYLDYGTNFHIRFLNAYLSNLYTKKPSWSLKSQIYYRNSTVMDNTIAYITTDTGQVGYYRPNSLIGLEEKFDYEGGSKANLVAGIVMEAEQLASDFSITYSDDPEKAPAKPEEPDYENNTLISFYVQTQYKFWELVEMTAGARLDQSSYYGTILTPRLSFVYSHKNYTGKLLYTEAFRAPRPWDYNWGIGNPDLKPERMKSIELANNLNFNQRLRCDFSLFHNQIYDMLIEKDSCWVNAERINTNGLELNLDYRRKKMQLNLNYTFTDSKFSDGKQVPEIARHGFNAGVTYSLLTNLNVNLRGNYLSRRKNPVFISTTKSHYVDPYFVLNSVINYNPIPNLKLQIAVNNLLNARYYHTSNRPPERYRQPQRVFLFKLGYQL